MKKYRILATFAFGLMLHASGARAWSQWYYQDLPYSPGFWLYQTFPEATGTAPGLVPSANPWFHYSRMVPQSMSWWSSPVPMSGLTVEQSQSPVGYTIRVVTTGQATVDLGVDGRTLVIRSRNVSRSTRAHPMQMSQSGWASQWVSLPGDANFSAMRVARRPGLAEIFVPRLR